MLRLLLFGFLMSGSFLGAEPVVSGAKHDSLLLLSELNCTACHAGPDWLRPKGAPILKEGKAQSIRRPFLEKFLHDPGAAQPGSTMPDVLGSLEGKERQEAVEALSDYLASLASQPKEALERYDPEKGRELYHEVGCVACHPPEGKEVAGLVPLDHVAEKYEYETLVAFLDDPLKVRPGGRMPDCQLEHEESLALASYLLRDAPPKADDEDPHRVDGMHLGQQLFKKQHCAQCHDPGAKTLAEAPALSELVGKGDCGKVKFSFSEDQKKQVAAALEKAALPAEEKLETLLVRDLARYNCLACHERGDLGGVDPGLDEFFTTSNLNLGEQARLPPTLTGVGAKLQPDWLRKVVVLGSSVRPYTKTRMPRFGPEAVGHLPELFTAADQDVFPELEIPREKDFKIARNHGHQLAGDKQLACVACHTWKGESATTLNAIELSTMGTRLEEQWFHHYMRGPERFARATIMPNFWPNGKATRPEILEGDPGQQIDALWQYLQRGREARTPSGIKREPIEYGPGKDGRPVIFRRQYNGIGKRGIGVGFANEINAAFDASQFRLGSVWKGRFGEMSGVWRGQGSGNVHESSEVVRFLNGPGMAKLANKESPWPSLEKGVRAEEFQFLGYDLDKKGAPLFRYRMGELGITDSLARLVNTAAMIRTIRFDKAPPEGLWLRVAGHRDLAQGRDGSLRFPKDLKVTLTDSEGLVIRDLELLEGDKKVPAKEAILPLAGRKEVAIRYDFEEEESK